MRVLNSQAGLSPFLEAIAHLRIVHTQAETRGAQDLKARHQKRSFRSIDSPETNTAWRKIPWCDAGRRGARRATGAYHLGYIHTAWDAAESNMRCLLCSMGAALAEFHADELGQDAEEDVDFIVENGALLDSSYAMMMLTQSPQTSKTLLGLTLRAQTRRGRRRTSMRLQRRWSARRSARQRR